jgi:hypothetical protein
MLILTGRIQKAKKTVTNINKNRKDSYAVR